MEEARDTEVRHLENVKDSILLSTKKLLGIEPEMTAFDDALILHINTALSVLHQLGVGPEGGICITDGSTTWDELTGGDSRLSMVRTYVQMKVRMMFDPPTSSAVMDSMDKLLKETEWRILAVTDYGTGGSGAGGECVDEVARAEIRAHENDRSIHKNDRDIDNAIGEIKVIRCKL